MTRRLRLLFLMFTLCALLPLASCARPPRPCDQVRVGSHLIDAVEHRVRGMIVIFDNRRMAAITGLQLAQYGRDFRTNDSVSVDYVQLASAVKGVKAVFGGTNADQLRTALKSARDHDGLSVVHVPVYAGPDELAGLGAFGQWNVGNWCEAVQREWLEGDI